MDVWSDQVIEFVENAVNHFNQEVALLVLQGGRHKQWQNLVEQRTCSKFTSLICDLTQRSLEQEGGDNQSEDDRNYRKYCLPSGLIMSVCCFQQSINVYTQTSTESGSSSLEIL